MDKFDDYLGFLLEIKNKGEHECTHGWPGSVPVGTDFKIETQIRVVNKVQVTGSAGQVPMKIQVLVI